MRVLFSSILFVFLVCIVSGPALADIDEEATIAFDEGKQQFADGQFAKAADSFRKAYELKKSWRLLYNIGHSEAAAKRYGLALEAFERYLGEAGDDINASRRDGVLSEIKQLRDMVGSLIVDAPDELVVIVDGVRRGKTPLLAPITVSSGVEHNVVIESDDSVILEKTVLVRGGQTTEVVVKAEIEEKEEITKTPVEEPKDETSKPTTPQKKIGIILIGTGAALLIGGGISGGMALSLNSDLKDDCSDGTCVSSQEQDRVDKRKNLALTADILIGVGAAVALTGVLLATVFNKNKEDSDGTELAVSPVIGPGTVGAALDWRF